MTFSLRTTLLAIAVLAAVSAVVAPSFRPQPVFQLSGRKSTVNSRFASATSSRIFFGPNIPTLIFGDAQSKFVPYLAENQLPFAICIIGEDFSNLKIESAGADFDSEDNVFLSTTIDNGNHSLEVVYKVIVKDENREPLVSEQLELNGATQDLSKGRLFELNLSTSNCGLRQINLDSIDRSIIPKDFLGANSDPEAWRAILDWWRSIEPQCEQ